jgi:hypothetical protein
MLKPEAVVIRPRPIHLCHKMELKSRWTVPSKVGYGKKFGTIEKRH